MPIYDVWNIDLIIFDRRLQVICNGNTIFHTHTLRRCNYYDIDTTVYLMLELNANEELNTLFNSQRSLTVSSKTQAFIHSPYYYWKWDLKSIQVLSFNLKLIIFLMVSESASGPGFTSYLSLFLPMPILLFICSASPFLLNSLFSFRWAFNSTYRIAKYHRQLLPWVGHQLISRIQQ